MNPKTTQKGHIENGMIDEITHTYPDIVKILNTYNFQDFQQE